MHASDGCGIARQNVLTVCVSMPRLDCGLIPPGKGCAERDGTPHRGAESAIDPLPGLDRRHEGSDTLSPPA